MILKDLIGEYPIKNCMGQMDIDITGINHDSRKITTGNIFIALKGFTVDGHKYIKDAIRNGAKVILIEDDIELEEEVTIIKVEDTIDALGFLSKRYYYKTNKYLKIIAITGTNGKTSTSYFLKSILEKHNKRTALLGTTGVIMGDINLKLLNTTPDALVIQENLNSMVENNMEYCVMEVSSHALDLKRVDYIDFHRAIFTNLTPEHLDYHKTMELYFNSKEKLFYNTKESHIINIDDEYGVRLWNTFLDKIRIVTYGIKEKANVYATNAEYFIEGTNFILNTPLDKIEVHLNTPGEFNIYNALAAAACAYSQSIPIHDIKAGLESVLNIRGRFEIIPTNSDFTIIIDFAHTADGLEKVLKTIKQLSTGRIIVVFGAGGNRDQGKRPEMGEIVGTYSDIAILTSDNPRLEEPFKIIKDIEIGIKRTNTEYIIIVNRKKAIEYALKIARAKDIILLAGKGHETYTIIGDKIYDLDERQLIKDIIGKK